MGAEKEYRPAINTVRGIPENMTAYENDLQKLLANLRPEIHPGVFVYSSVSEEVNLDGVPLVGTFRENEGLTVILAESEAIKKKLPILFQAAWITLSVNSDLNAVGLTAAVSTVLANAGISCNLVAGAFHDHLFVPYELGEKAIELLNDLARKGVKNQ